jgi:hypothetical protein
MQGASQLLIKYSRHGLFGRVLQIRILKIFLNKPMVSNFELPCTKGPKTLPLVPVNLPSLFLLATSNLGNFSSEILRYV